jgi:hypothetical protein
MLTKRQSTTKQTAVQKKSSLTESQQLTIVYVPNSQPTACTLLVAYTESDGRGSQHLSVLR